MLIVKLVFPDQYQAGRVCTQNVSSNTMANKRTLNLPYLPRQKHDLAFLMLFLHVIKRDEFSPVVPCEISSEKLIWHPSQCELLGGRILDC